MVQVHERRVAEPVPAAATPLTPLVISWEPLAFIGLMLLGFVLRLHELGYRAYHHDESLHAVYSWYLFTGRGYIHDPMMHGPFQFHFNALMYFLFGDNDVTARLQPALLGTLFIGMPYLLRRELGRVGALTAALLLAISPIFLYFSRFSREDMPFAFWTMVTVVGLFGYLRTHRPAWLYAAAAGLAFAFATKETTYISGFIVVTFFLGMAALSRRLELGRSVWAALQSVSLAHWLIAIAIFLGINVTLYTTFFTNTAGFCSMAISHETICGETRGALNYWLNQQEVRRGGQPWFYYLLLLPLYEFVPIAGALAAAAFLPRIRRGVFFWFSMWWAALSLLIYSWAGEKMPWLGVHLTLPLILLAAQFADWYVSQVTWPSVRTRQALWAFGLGLVTMALFASWVSLGAASALAPVEGQRLALQRLGVSLLVAVGVFGIVYLGWRYSKRVVVPSVLAAVTVLLAVFYVHTTWQVTYEHADIPVELLVYVQSSQDDPWVTAEIERIGQQLGKGKDVGILMDNGYTETVNDQSVSHESIAWPFEWYLRDFTNRRYFTKTLPDDVELADYPIVLVMGPNLEPIKDQLGDYHGQQYKLNWWFPEDYKNLSWSSALKTLADPVSRAKLLKFVLYREPMNPAPLGAREFYFYVRNDVPALGPGPLPDGVSTTPRQEPAEQPQAQAVAVAGGAIAYGRAIDGRPMLTEPKGIAVGPDGRLYVAEGGANKVTILNADGTIAASWGRKGKGEGQFNEPWGIAVAPDGSVYVADTWNHRVQKFSPSGEFLVQWGGVGDAKGRTDQEQGKFWGPRAVAVGADGSVYVTDTGNKRVEVFDAEGTFLRAFGGQGSEPGQFHEPVGIALDAAGNVYVADAWNGRVQKLDPNGAPIAAYAVEGWENQSVRNKPYLAVDGGGRVYLSFPELAEVRVLDTANGLPPATFAPDGAPLAGQPVGVAVLQNGSVYVSDARGGVVIQYAVPR